MRIHHDRSHFSVENHRRPFPCAASGIWGLAWPLIGLLIVPTGPGYGADRPETQRPPASLAPPVVDGPWLRPVAGPAAQPIWGFKEGLAVGLWPTRGPRGLIRIYCPAAGAKPPRMINFISIEPVARGSRGQSELEMSQRDGTRGKALGTGNHFLDEVPREPPWQPAAGRVIQIDGTEALTFFIAVEPFRNGARPVLQVLFRRDRPTEVALRVYAARGSVPMNSCVLSATMGNYARLRRLWLRGEVVDAHLLWPTFKPDRLGFAPWRQWPANRLYVVNGEAVVAALPDEAEPAQAEYDGSVREHWRYQGRPATQYWRTALCPGLVARVNGRTTYWGGQSPIPGGISYENFELEAPFRAGQEFRFGITLEPPEKLGFDPAWAGKLTDGRFSKR